MPSQNEGIVSPATEPICSADGPGVAAQLRHEHAKRQGEPGTEKQRQHGEFERGSRVAGDLLGHRPAGPE